MTINRISAALEQADRDAVMAEISTIREKAAVLAGFDARGAQDVAKKEGDKSRAFVSKALEVATQNSDFLPRSFDLELNEIIIFCFIRAGEVIDEPTAVVCI